MVYEFFEELKLLIKEKIKSFYIKCKYLLLILLFIVLVLLIFLCEKEEPEIIETQQLKVCGITIENWSQWITIIVIPFTAGWALFQFKKGRDIKKQEKAVDIAREFSENLVEDLEIINIVLYKSGLLQKISLNEEQVKKIEYFNVEEARRIKNDDDCIYEYNLQKEEYRERLNNIYHVLLYNQFTILKVQEFNLLLFKAILDKLSNEDLEKMHKVLENKKSRPYDFLDFKDTVLNKLEYICMNISSKAADSKYIYQSLHQTFLRTIRNLYMDMASANTDYKDKFYTNIIHVYNEWKKLYLKESRLEERRIKKANQKMNPKTKTV